MALSEEMRGRLQGIIAADEVVLFMKGTRARPQCGFSASVVQVLDELVPSYQTVDVLADPEVRDGIKELSAWPTIPQLYVRGEFVGGADIVREMHGSRELEGSWGSRARRSCRRGSRSRRGRRRCFARRPRTRAPMM